jgi:hypothetical protein|tara:strand:- start:229 stop:480 length:252 start_codon:yes stop_codon:yes gene_type:complete
MGGMKFIVFVFYRPVRKEVSNEVRRSAILACSRNPREYSAFDLITLAVQYCSNTACSVVMVENRLVRTYNVTAKRADIVLLTK